MTTPELAHLELLAEVDALSERLGRWADAAPAWQPADACRALVRRLLERAGALRVRLEAPLVVATLGGTGTGKSALVNALVGADVVLSGRSRPTTMRPVLVCRPDLRPEQLGIDASQVDLVQRDLPSLRDLVLIDCPDPDTTEDTHASGTNLARLRPVLAHCDVLLVTTTQQKYRSARVSDELASAAPGARLVFVQTHADQDDDIREDWRHVLQEHYAPGHVFLVDSLSALSAVQSGAAATGDFARLVDLLTRQLAGSAGNRIRRANFLDLVADTLAVCRRRVDGSLDAVNKLQEAILQQRTQLAARLASETRGELLAHRRQWETRLLGRVVARWGFSPFSLLLRLFQGLGGLVTRAALLRARTPAQVALWGTVEGVRSWQARRSQKQADQAASQAVAGCWDEAELRTAAIVIAGYASDAGLPPQHAAAAQLGQESARTASRFAEQLSAQLDSLLERQAARHCGWFTRFCYEFLLLAMLGMLGYRLGKNFFYDSWLAPQPTPVYGMDFYLSAGFWLVVWCLLLFWLFSSRLRRGLRRQLDGLAVTWTDPRFASGWFAQLESDAQRIDQFRLELTALDQQVTELRARLALPDDQLGHVR